MELTLLAEDPQCAPGMNCPTVHATDGALTDPLIDAGDATAVVQGYLVKNSEALAALNLSVGEAAVEIPLSLLLASAARVSWEISR